MKPKVSVIMTAFNQEAYVDRAIAGVMHQKGNFDIELLIANDASTDGTLDRVMAWQRRYPNNIRVINHPKNLGLAPNYLSAFREATGDYLCICDSDDYWISSHKLERQVRYMESHPECAITFHRVINIYEPEGVKTLSNGGTPVDSTIRELSRSNFITNSSVMYRRRLVPAEDLPDWLATVSSPDYVYHMLYAIHGTVHYFKRPTAVYLKHPQSDWSLSGEEKRLRMSFDVRQRLMEHFGLESPAYQGLKEASDNILRALENLKKPTAKKQSFLKKAYRKLTTFLPAPKPC